jgi:UDP-N-acetylglucosamine 2-epimerase (non-hydrolysing)
VNRVLDGPPAQRRPELWDGRASERIADVLLEGGTASTRPRPTDVTTDVTTGPTADQTLFV